MLVTLSGELAPVVVRVAPPLLEVQVVRYDEMVAPPLLPPEAEASGPLLDGSGGVSLHEAAPRREMASTPQTGARRGGIRGEPVMF